MYLSASKRSSIDSTPSPINDTNAGADDEAGLPTLRSPCPPLVPERSDFLEGDAPAADKVAAFLPRALEATGSAAGNAAAALVPWICDALLSNHLVKAHGRFGKRIVVHYSGRAQVLRNAPARRSQSTLLT